MAQTRKKRRSKHRGNAAGSVEARGRTSKAARTGTTAKAAAKRPTTARERRAARLAKPPTLKGAAYKGFGAAVVFFLLMVVLFDQNAAQAGFLASFMVFLYVPLSYYTDRFIYARQQKRKGS